MIKEIKLHDDWICCLDISPNGKYIATGSEDKTCKINELESLGIKVKCFCINKNVPVKSKKKG